MLIPMCCVICFGQKPQKKNDVDLQQKLINKKNLIGNFEYQIKDVPYAVVRSYIRSKIAEWLWQNGKDDTGMADDIAVRSLEEIYERKNEIPDIYFSSIQTDILSLLEKNSPATAKKIKEKYKIGEDESLDSAYSLLDSKDGDKKVSEKLNSFLNNQKELSPVAADLIQELSARKSPHLVTVLSQIVLLEESGISGFSPDTLFFIINAFRNSVVPNDLRVRFYNIVIRKGKESAATNDIDLQIVYELLYAISGDISKNAPDLLSESASVLAALTARVNSLSRENNEIYEKIESSSDRISAMISAAESTENEFLKKDLYKNASLLALKKKKFKLAVDLSEKSLAGENLDDEKNKFSFRWHDHFLGDVSDQSLRSDDTDSSKYASDKITDKLIHAEVLKKKSLYFFDKQNTVNAVDTLDEATVLTDKTDNSALKIKMLLRLIPVFQKVNKIQTGYIVGRASKAINSLPTLNIDDKPETENYKKYVTSIMIININLLSCLDLLIKENKAESLYLADIIDRREIKIIADYVVLKEAIK